MLMTISLSFAVTTINATIAWSGSPIANLNNIRMRVYHGVPNPTQCSYININGNQLSATFNQSITQQITKVEIYSNIINPVSDIINGRNDIYPKRIDISIAPNTTYNLGTVTLKSFTNTTILVSTSQIGFTTIKEAMEFVDIRRETIN